MAFAILVLALVYGFAKMSKNEQFDFWLGHTFYIILVPIISIARLIPGLYYFFYACTDKSSDISTEK